VMRNNYFDGASHVSGMGVAWDSGGT
jgi:hypothetical protein